MKISSPVLTKGFLEGFTKTCMNAGVDERTAAGLYEKALVRDLVANDPHFARGFHETMQNRGMRKQAGKFTKGIGDMWRWYADKWKRHPFATGAATAVGVPAAGAGAAATLGLPAWIGATLYNMPMGKGMDPVPTGEGPVPGASGDQSVSMPASPFAVPLFMRNQAMLNGGTGNSTGFTDPHGQLLVYNKQQLSNVDQKIKDADSKLALLAKPGTAVDYASRINLQKERENLFNFRNRLMRESSDSLSDVTRRSGQIRSDLAGANSSAATAAKQMAERAPMKGSLHERFMRALPIFGWGDESADAVNAGAKQKVLEEQYQQLGPFAGKALPKDIKLTP